MAKLVMAPKVSRSPRLMGSLNPEYPEHGPVQFTPAFVVRQFRKGPPQKCDIVNDYTRSLTLNQTLINFERKIGLGSTFAARLLGVAYQTYASYRNERRLLPLYHARHIRCLLLLPKDVLQQEIEELTNAKRKPHVRT